MAALGLLVTLAGCKRGRDARTPDGPTSESDKQRYIKRAIRSSNEGVIVLPSRRAESVFELPRLNEIAHNMRRPMAACFLERAVRTMEGTSDPEQPFRGVPEGQLKIRARINPGGVVVRAEVLETGFTDTEMEPCLTDVVRMQHWPENQGGNIHYIDVVYWVSLGLQGNAHSDEAKAHLRREQVAAGVRAKACLKGRVDAGTYEVHGLNLVSSEGGTMANRVDHPMLPDQIRSCIAHAFQKIRLPREADAFVRPVTPVVSFRVGADGVVGVHDEEWLAMVELEERAHAAKDRGDRAPEDRLDDGRRSDLADTLPPTGEPFPGTAPEPTAEPEVERVDPGQGGLRLNLGGRGDVEAATPE